jgi:hypothetical protein
MYSISVVKNFYDRGSVLKWFFKKSEMMDCKSMANSHDDSSEEDEIL